VGIQYADDGTSAMTQRFSPRWRPRGLASIASRQAWWPVGPHQRRRRKSGGGQHSQRVQRGRIPAEIVEQSHAQR